MSNVNKLAETLGELIGYIKNFFSDRGEYYKLTAIEFGSKAGGNLIFGILLAVLAFLIFLFFLLALAAYIVTLVESTSLAFLIVGGILIVLAVLLYLLRKPLIINPILNSIIDNSHKDEN